MANKTIDMEQAFATMPELPENFESNVIYRLPRIPIFYKRNGKIARCICGKCGMEYDTKEVPVRNYPARCPMCGNDGTWEWSKVTRPQYGQEDVTLVQCTSDKNIVLRIFRVSYKYQQWYKADITVKEKRRYFLHIGEVYKFYNNRVYRREIHTWGDEWGRAHDHESVNIQNLYPGWKNQLEKSKFKYCDPVEITGAMETYFHRGDALIAYANNPAIEMYAKARMKYIVSHLLSKEGKTKLINRRAKTLYGQLRIKDKQALNRLIKEEGYIDMLRILQKEKKLNIRYTDEQVDFMLRRMKDYKGEQKLNWVLEHMTIQKLINRIEKYKEQGDYPRESQAFSAYYDYLEMRDELGYDMTNEVYLYPKNLKQKHDQMVKERNERRDQLHGEKMCRKYPDISNRYKKLLKKYGMQFDGYVIRPARSAAEIVDEGRELHHCVGGENYLRKHNKGETTILFLRKAITEDVPYYTIEIRDTEIIQWYGIKDSKPDKEIIGPWLDTYVSYLRNAKEIKADVENRMLLLAAG